jgi:glutaredoxin
MPNIDKELVMYSRTTYCPYLSTARRVLSKYDIPYREIMINEDETALQRVLDWTGFRSVPTIILAEPGEDLPFEEPQPLKEGDSPRGVDRGSMITEPSSYDLEKWLRKHGFID